MDIEGLGEDFLRSEFPTLKLSPDDWERVQAERQRVFDLMRTLADVDVGADLPHIV